MELKLVQELKAHQYVVLNTKGVSMRPLLREGETHVIVEKPTGDLPRHSLPIYQRRDGALVLHRIVGVKKNHYRIRGDNCYTTEVVPKDWVVGVVVKIYKDDRYITMDDRDYRRYIVGLRVSYPFRWVKFYGKRGAKKLVRVVKSRGEKI